MARKFGRGGRSTSRIDALRCNRLYFNGLKFLRRMNGGGLKLGTVMRTCCQLLIVCLLALLVPGAVSPQQPQGRPGMQAQPALQARNVGWLVYRNDTNGPVIVQSASLGANGRLQPGAPHPINPRGAAWDQISGAGPRMRIVYDAQQKVLFQGQVNFVGQNLAFSIQQEAAVKGNEKAARARLVPVALPGMMQGNPGALAGPSFAPSSKK